MSEVAPNPAPTAGSDEPKVETHTDAPTVAHGDAHEAPQDVPHEVHADAVPEAEASVEQVIEPDPEHAPEPAPAPPPELAEVAAISESVAVEIVSEALVPLPEPVSEELVPVSEPASDTGASAADVTAAPPPAEEEPKAKAPKRTRTPKAPKTPVADAASTPVPDAPTDTDPPTVAIAEPAEVGGEPKPENKKKWYAIKVQSGREDTIKAAILRKVAIEGLEDYFGQIVIPFEEEVVKKTVRVKDKKTGDYTTQEKKVTRKKKKFQGYLFAELEFNDRILYLFRETSGVGDFLNLRGTPPVPEPMPEHEVQSMLTGERHADPMKKGGKAKIKIEFEKGDRIRVREGSFANQEGEVKAITEPKDPTDTPKVTVVLTFWGRPLEVELDYWQVEKV